MSSKVMRSLLWFLLLLSTSAVSSEESERSDDSTSESRSPVFALADSIYSKQRECESIIGEAVDKVIDEGASNKLPIPDERYFLCKKTLDEKKREYMRTALVGLVHYETVFPMRLSSGRVVILPVPVEENPSGDGDQAGFDIQEELCATNKICLKITIEKISIEQKERFLHCAALLNNLKLKYINIKKLDENELEKQRGLNVKCSEGAVTFFLPKQIKNSDYQSISHPTDSVESKVKTVALEGKDSIKEPSEVDNPYRGVYDEVMKELNSIYGKNSKDDEHDSKSEISISGSTGEKKSAQEESESKDPSIHEVTTETEDDVTTDDATNEHQSDISKPLEEVDSSTDKTTEEKINTDDDSLSQKEEQLSDTDGQSESSPGSPQYTTIETPKNIALPDESQKSSNNENKKTNEEVGRKKTKPRKKKTLKIKSDENIELVSYRVNVLSKNGDGKVVKIQASGRIKKTEKGGQAPILQELFTKNHNVLTTGDKADSRLDNTLIEDNETKMSHPESLEYNIIMLENDCKELLLFGEQLLNHKMLSSLMNFENQYNECMGNLDRLKEMYIENHKVDVMSHRNIFPLTLPSGKQKLVFLPTQFLKKDLVEKRSPSNLKPTDVFEAGELDRKYSESENTTFRDRKPFDDPALIPNDEFLENLQQGSAPSDTSTLSKVASMLHMNGGHSEKKVTE